MDTALILLELIFKAKLMKLNKKPPVKSPKSTTA